MKALFYDFLQRREFYVLGSAWSIIRNTWNESRGFREALSEAKYDNAGYIIK